jgi:hypothetical protein
MSKTLRQFQCRDDLWARVDALAKRRGISTDDVIQAALMQLFKSKKKEGEPSAITPVPGQVAAAGPPRPTTTPPRAPGPPAPAGLPRPPGPPAPAGAARPPAAGPASPAPAPSASTSMGAAASPASKTGTMAPRLPRPASSPVSTVPTPAAAPPSISTPAAAPAKAAPTLPRPQQPAANPTPSRLPPPAAKPASQQVRPLYLMFENQWYEIDKEEYVIGRGQKFSDLPIKDANISRRHCSIVRRGPDYFIKDLGSTNGVEFEGTRVDNHKIVEGSVYFLCDHELRFSFTPPGAAS